MHKLQLKDAARFMSATSSKDSLFCGVSVDSRLHQKQNLFFALEGAKTDGHHYLQEVALKGAVGAVVKSNYTGSDYGLNLLYVEDPLKALQDLARHIIKKNQPRIVAVTGSVGKTTTKDFITTLLREKFKVASSPGNSNSQIGIPLTILNHTSGNEEILVLEMGMTHPGNIQQLLSIAPPECALITTVALVHACNFDSLESIAKTKAEILEHPETKVGIIHRDIVNYEEISKIGSCQKMTFSLDHSLADYLMDGTDAESFNIIKDNQIIKLGKFPIPGKHNRMNFIAAASCARYFGVSWEEIVLGMNKIALPPLRWQTIEKDGIYFINDSYNASPIAVKAALENIPSPNPGGKKIAIFSDMLELGKFSESSHREIGHYALNYVDELYCYGNECRYIAEVWQKANRHVLWFPERQDLIFFLKKHLKRGDVVLIKGSRSTQISKLVDELETSIQ